MIEPPERFKLFVQIGNKTLYESEGQPTIFVSYIKTAGEEAVTIAQGSHMVGEYRNGNPVTGAPDYVFRKVIHSDLPNVVKGAIDRKALDLQKVHWKDIANKAIFKSTNKV